MADAKPAPTPKPPKAPKVVLPATTNVIVYRRTKKVVKEDAKLAPQEAAILSVLESFGAERDVLRKELLPKLTAEVLKTRQEPARILSFYQNHLVEDGYITKKTVAMVKQAA